MSIDRVPHLEALFLERIKSYEGKQLQPESIFDESQKKYWKGLFESQLISRLLDYEARVLKKSNQAFYTISSAGHEGNVILGRLLRSTDPCFLHYRSGALMVSRLRELGRESIIKDMLRSLCASRKDSVSGGRHKVWGSKTHWTPPQTSTIASHLPKAVGAAFGIERARKLGLRLDIPGDSLVCCSFGDASVNHSTAAGAFNTARWIRYQNLKLPLLFVCEDNGMGISVRTPQDWVKNLFCNNSQIKYVSADAGELEAAHEQSQKAIVYCRRYRAPVFLHLKTARLLAHAGSDIQQAYLSASEISANEAQDPLLRSVDFIIKNKIMSADGILKQYTDLKLMIRDIASSVVKEPKLSSRAELMTPLNIPAAVSPEVKFEKQAREKYWNSNGLPEKNSRKWHMAKLINMALQDSLLAYPEVVIFGEDVARKGGVYHITEKLEAQFGKSRVFNTVLDEQSILGLAIGLSHLGFLPLPEIQYLAYYHNACDQIRGEAASMQFFSAGQYSNPMLIRVASFAYQKGFGGHFHNDNSIAALRDIPGVMIAAPSRGDDAVYMLREALALSKTDGKPIFFLEPIALYMQKDLFQEGDQKWCFHYPEYLTSPASTRSPRVYLESQRELSVFTYANGVHLSLQAWSKLPKNVQKRVRIIDLRWLKPLAEEALVTLASESEKILIVDECRENGGIADTLLRLFAAQIKKPNSVWDILSAADTYLPLGPATDTVLPSASEIQKKMRALLS